MRIVDTLLKKAEDFAGEVTFSVLVQTLCVRFWKRIVLLALPLAWGLWDIFSSLYVFISEFSLEQVISDHPYSALLSSVFVMWFTSSTLPK